MQKEKQKQKQKQWHLSLSLLLSAINSQQREAEKVPRKRACCGASGTLFLHVLEESAIALHGLSELKRRDCVQKRKWSEQRVQESEFADEQVVVALVGVLTAKTAEPIPEWRETRHDVCNEWAGVGGTHRPIKA